MECMLEDRAPTSWCMPAIPALERQRKEDCELGVCSKTLLPKETKAGGRGECEIERERERNK